MIIEGRQCGEGQALAARLMNARDNGHVELHDMRGFISEDLAGAFFEIEVVADAGTRCEQPFFSVSIDPPQGHAPGRTDFMAAIDAIEARFPQLAETARAVIFYHGQDGQTERLRCHAVWSRIDENNCKAVQLSYSRLKLKAVSRAMHRAMGIKPPGRNRAGTGP